MNVVPVETFCRDCGADPKEPCVDLGPECFHTLRLADSLALREERRNEHRSEVESNYPPPSCSDRSRFWHRAMCGCGFVGEQRGTWEEAAADGFAHDATSLPEMRYVSRWEDAA